MLREATQNIDFFMLSYTINFAIPIRIGRGLNMHVGMYIHTMRMYVNCQFLHFAIHLSTTLPDGRWWVQTEKVFVAQLSPSTFDQS